MRIHFLGWSSHRVLYAMVCCNVVVLAVYVRVFCYTVVLAVCGRVWCYAVVAVYVGLGESVYKLSYANACVPMAAAHLCTPGFLHLLFNNYARQRLMHAR